MYSKNLERLLEFQENTTEKERYREKTPHNHIEVTVSRVYSLWELALRLPFP